MKPTNVTYVLNIGADRKGAPDITPGELWNAFRLAGVCPVLVDGPRWKDHDKGGEPTYAAQFDEQPTDGEIAHLCHTLGQDAIAIACLPLSTDYHGAIALWGALVGPRAHEWGAFDPSQFMLPGGLPLSSVMASA